MTGRVMSDLHQARSPRRLPRALNQQTRPGRLDPLKVSFIITQTTTYALTPARTITAIDSFPPSTCCRIYTSFTSFTARGLSCTRPGIRMRSLSASIILRTVMLSLSLLPHNLCVWRANLNKYNLTKCERLTSFHRVRAFPVRLSMILLRFRWRFAQNIQYYT